MDSKQKKYTTEGFILWVLGYVHTAPFLRAQNGRSHCWRFLPAKKRHPKWWMRFLTSKLRLTYMSMPCSEAFFTLVNAGVIRRVFAAEN